MSTRRSRDCKLQASVTHYRDTRPSRAGEKPRKGNVETPRPDPTITRASTCRRLRRCWARRREERQQERTLQSLCHRKWSQTNGSHTTIYCAAWGTTGAVALRSKLRSNQRLAYNHVLRRLALCKRSGALRACCHAEIVTRKTRNPNAEKHVVCKEKSRLRQNYNHRSHLS